MWKRGSREYPCLLYTTRPLGYFLSWASAIHTYARTHTCAYTQYLRRVCNNVCTQYRCTQCSDGPHALLRLSSDGPTTWKTVRDSLRSTCANKVLEASLVSSPAATHTWTEKGETTVTSLSQLAHYYLLNICWIFLVLFCFTMGWEWMLCYNPNTVKFCIFHILCKNRHLNQ